VSFVRIDNNRSVEVLGVRILVKEVDNAVRTAWFVARYGSVQRYHLHPNTHTLEAANLLADEVLTDALTHLVRDFFRDILFHEMLLHTF